MLGLQLPSVITGSVKPAALAALSPVSCLPSATGASWAHLPNELPAPKSLSQGQLLGEPKLRQIGIMYSFQSKGCLNMRKVRNV